jgi:hypothetical protein
LDEENILIFSIVFFKRSIKSTQQMKLKSILTITFVVCQVFAVIAQDSYTTYFITPELRMNFDKPAIEIRYRPLDYYAPWGVFRTELMAGGVFSGGKLKVFSHTRLDNGVDYDNTYGRKFRSSTGIRVDFNDQLMIANKPLLMNIQYRRFIPLNENSSHQYVFVQDNSYKLWEKVWPSLLGFMTAKRGSGTSYGDWGTPNWWLGPGVVIHWKKNLNTYFCYLPDIIGGDKPYIFLRLQFKVKA